MYGTIHSSAHANDGSANIEVWPVPLIMSTEEPGNALDIETALAAVVRKLKHMPRYHIVQ